MVVCFGDHTKPDGFVDDYSIKSTLNSIKSLIYRLDTPYMSNKAKSSQQLYDAIRPVIETQGKLCGPKFGLQIGPLWTFGLSIPVLVAIH